MASEGSVNKPLHKLAKHAKANKKRLIVVLEQASLETVKVRSCCVLNVAAVSCNV